MRLTSSNLCQARSSAFATATSTINTSWSSSCDIGPAAMLRVCCAHRLALLKGATERFLCAGPSRCEETPFTLHAKSSPNTHQTSLLKEKAVRRERRDWDDREVA